MHQHDHTHGQCHGHQHEHAHGHGHAHGTKAELQKQKWAKFAPVFNLMDSTSTTFYYTLINMLELPKAKHILQVGCGSGKLLHQAAYLKSTECTYLATDLSTVMLDLCKDNLKNHLTKMGVTVSAEEWMGKHNLTLKQANGEHPIESPHKFDRIIANLVIHHAEHPLEMLKNLSDLAEPGCLLGVTEFGKEELNDLLRYVPEAYKAKGQEQPKGHHHHENLYGKLAEMGEKTGWETVLIWQQRAPCPFRQSTDLMKCCADFLSHGDDFVSNYILDRFRNTLQNKQALGMTCQLAIFRKK